MRKDHLIELIKNENNPVVIERAIDAMQTDPRLKFVEEKFKVAKKEAKGRAKIFFSAMHDALIFDRGVIYELLGKPKNSKSLDALFEIVDEQIDGAYVDLGRKHGDFIKLAHLIREALKGGRLPLVDDDGDPVPIYPRYTLFDNPAGRIELAIAGHDQPDEHTEDQVDDDDNDQDDYMKSMNKAIFDEE